MPVCFVAEQGLYLRPYLYAVKPPPYPPTLVGTLTCLHHSSEYPSLSTAMDTLAPPRRPRPASWPWTVHDGSTSTLSTTAPVNWTTLPAKDEKQTPTYEDSDFWTRNLCIGSLVLGWGALFSYLAIAINIIIAGPTITPSWLLLRVAIIGPMGYSWDSNPKALYNNDHRVNSVSETSMVLIPLLL